MPESSAIPTAAATLRVEDLRVAYAGRAARPASVLRGVSFAIQPGEVVSLLGESGCGKTTTARAILRLLPPTAAVSGSILLGGHNLLGMPEKELRAVRGARIAAIFQEAGAALNPVLRVADQVAEVWRAHSCESRRRSREEAERCLALTGLTSARLWQAYPHQLSGGQLQRVQLAQALICRPALILADEPTASLDAAAERELLALLRRLARQFEVSILWITHSPLALAGFTDRVLIMYAGQIVEMGNAARVAGAPMHPYTQALLNCIPSGTIRKAHLPAIPGSAPDAAELPSGCAFAPRCGRRTAICQDNEPQSVRVGSDEVRCFLYGH